MPILFVLLIDLWNRTTYEEMQWTFKYFIALFVVEAVVYVCSEYGQWLHTLGFRAVVWHCAWSLLTPLETMLRLVAQALAFVVSSDGPCWLLLELLEAMVRSVAEAVVFAPWWRLWKLLEAMLHFLTLIESVAPYCVVTCFVIGWSVVAVSV